MATSPKSATIAPYYIYYKGLTSPFSKTAPLVDNISTKMLYKSTRMPCYHYVSSVYRWSNDYLTTFGGLIKGMLYE